MNNGISFRRIDTIAIIIIAYFLIKWADSNSILPIWCALGATAVIGIIFYQFLPYGNTGRLIQAFACIFETYFLITLLPFAKGIKNSPLAEMDERISMTITAVIVYLLIFELHNHGTSKTITNIFKKIYRKKKTTAKSSSTASSAYREFDNTIYNNLLHALGYSDNFNQIPVHSFGSIEYIVSKNSYVYLCVLSSYTYVAASLRTRYTIKVHDQYGSLLETLETTVTVGKNEEFRDLLRLQERYHLYHCRKFFTEHEVQKQIYAWKDAEDIPIFDRNSQQFHSEKQAHTSSQSHSETHEQSSSQKSSETHSSQETSSQAPNDEALFNGCTDKESLTKRYHQLMKTFHPDNPNGDHEMSQRIQNAYDTLRKKYE